jgi:hypothetical protein
MDKIKPWQIILFIAAIGVLGFTAWKFAFSNGIPKTDGYLTVDIMTGQLYEVRKGKARGVPLPAKHPDTGDRTLYPVNQLDGLRYEIPVGFESFLTENAREGSVLDPGKLTITVSEEEAVTIVLVP